MTVGARAGAGPRVARSPLPVSGRRWRDPDRLGPAAFAVLFAIALIYVMHKADPNTLYYDDWTWLILRRSGWHGIISSYNQHLVAVPSVLYQILFRTAGLGHYWIYRLFGTLAHLGCMSAVYVFARRRIGVAAVALVLPLLFLGYGWEYVLWPINFGFMSSIGLSVCALLCLERDERRTGGLACGLLVLALACSEFTIPFVIGIAVELCWRDRSARRAYVWVAPLALYTIWWLGYHQPSSAADNLTAAPAFAADLAASAIGGLFGVSIDWGRPLLVAFVVLIGWRVTRREPTPRLVALLLAAGTFWLLVALGRAQLGEPMASRYIYTGAVLIALILAEAARGVGFGRRELAVALIVALFALAGNLRAMTTGEHQIGLGSATVRAELTVMTQIRAAVPKALFIDQTWMPGITAGEYFAAVDSLGSTPAESVTALHRAPEVGLTAADELLVRAGELAATPLAAGARPARTAPPFLVTSAAGAAHVTGACVRFDSAGAGAALDLRLPASGLQLHALPGPPVSVRARRFAAGFEGNPVTEIAGGQSVLLRPAVDSLPDPWYVRLSPNQAVTACLPG
ncbi:MAG: hypothetical protein M3Z06_04285 [Actinomycetota bacterium]|nr:hypothetical protein [Actinomycetota bacterium]